MERDLTHDEIINKMDLGNGWFNCLCGESLETDKCGDSECSECGRRYHFYIGVVAGEVIEPVTKNE